MSRPTEIYASSDGVWQVLSYYNGGAYLLSCRRSDDRTASVFLQGDDAVQFEKEFCDEDGYPISKGARSVLQGYLDIMTEDDPDGA